MGKKGSTRATQIKVKGFVTIVKIVIRPSKAERFYKSN